jgi:nitrite reductase (NO-forming)
MTQEKQAKNAGETSGGNGRSKGNTAIGGLAVAGLLILLPILAACNGGGQKGGAVPIRGEETAVLTYAPEVPPPITRKHATKVIVHMEVREVVKELAPGVQYTFWTFGGNVPGQFIRVREGDLVEFHLHNHPDSKVPHNIDLHAVTGQGGGAEASLTAPGHTSVFSFTVLNPGLYVYHCATAPVGMHIANGMYGLILVEPKEGLPKVDKEYYVMQSEFYTRGRHGEEGLQPFDMEKAVMEHPDYVVFNGSVGALMGDKAIKADVGETVRLFVGNGGPNLISSFHVIGEIFDRVYGEGGVKVNQEQVQTTLVPAGGSAIVEFGVEVPSTLILVDHSIFRAFNKGAIGMLKVSGPENHAVYSGKLGDLTYQPEGSAIQTMPDAESAAKAPTSLSKVEMMKRGERVYGQSCAACHQAGGEGIPHAFPPLAKSDYLMADKGRSIDVILQGLSGPITVNGVKYDGIMPALNLGDADAASVLTYIRNSFGNSGDAITVEEVKARRASYK